VDEVSFFQSWTKVNTDRFEKCTLLFSAELFYLAVQLIGFDLLQNCIKYVIFGRAHTLQTQVVILQIKQCWTGISASILLPHYHSWQTDNAEQQDRNTQRITHLLHPNTRAKIASTFPN